ncbi:MAG TPA: GNAT family N-acetyltransferase [Thermomicrobiales bacterium]|nr:GNAT family N-acetyltransferase [Thermomicrobiales bacterium]
MPSDIEIRPYQAGDEASLLATWNEAMWADPIEPIAWRTRYLLDPSFTPETCPVAVDRDTGDVIGFVLGFTGSATGQPGSDAWVVGFGVREAYRRQGIGRGLMQAFESRVRQDGASRVLYGPYIPSYITPGVDVAAYGEGIAFLTAIGASEGARPLSMKANLTNYRAAPGVAERERELVEGKITIRPAHPADILSLLAFLNEHFPHWKGDAAGVMRDLFGGDPRTVTLHIAEDDGTIIGYAQTRNERFGPFGVNEAYRGRGVGAVLLSRTLRSMRAQGFHSAWFLWTSDRTAKLYRQHGFEEVRRFAMVTKELGPTHP